MRHRFLLAIAAVALTKSAAAQEPAHNVSECIAANERAIALRKDHQLMSAREESVACAASSCPSEVREECARRAAQINGALPSIVFDVKDGDGNDVGAVHLEVDGANRTDGIDGTELVLDPGRHTVVFSSPGARVEKTFVLREGEKGRHEAIVLGAKKIFQPSTQSVPGAPKRSPVARVTGFGLAGLGLVGIGVGAFFGLRASTEWSRSKDECGSACPPAAHSQAVSDHDDAVQSATISTIAFVSGGMLLAGGAVLVFAAPVVTPKSASIGITARF